MSARRALGRQFGEVTGQLDMMRPARDLMDPSKTMSGLFRTGDADRLKSRWDSMRKEAADPRDGSGGGTLRAHIQDHGINTPVDLTTNHHELVAGGLGADTLVNGHHRTVVAHDINPDYLVPVKHFSTGNFMRPHPWRSR